MNTGLIFCSKQNRTIQPKRNEGPSEWREIEIIEIKYLIANPTNPPLTHHHTQPIAIVFYSNHFQRHIRDIICLTMCLYTSNINMYFTIPFRNEWTDVDNICVQALWFHKWIQREGGRDGGKREKQWYFENNHHVQ